MAVSWSETGLTTRQEIADFVSAIAGHFPVERAMLFGSYATGRAGLGSDVDLLLVMDFAEPRHKVAARMRWLCPSPFPLDLLLLKPAEFAALPENEPLLWAELERTGQTLRLS
ncbi:MAG: hypothetical protein GEEBNDBF_02445 [bacterium]|nr:hypothetical protein [bacterium]